MPGAAFSYMTCKIIKNTGQRRYRKHRKQNTQKIEYIENKRYKKYGE